MPDHSTEQGPFDQLAPAGRTAAGASGASLRLRERPIESIIDLRAKPTPQFLDRLGRETGIELPLASPGCTVNGSTNVFWMGPDHWWLLRDEPELSGADSLRESLADLGAGAVEIGDSIAAVALTGPKAGDVLAKGCMLDLHPRAFCPGSVAQTLLARAQITLHQTGPSAYEVFTRRSFAEYLWMWLEDAGLEYGIASGGS